jgi:hypothetical protein
MKDKPKFWSNSFLHDFRHWILESEKTGATLKGKHCKPINEGQKLADAIDCPFHEIEEIELAKSFCKNGGVIKEVVDDLYLIKTKKGRFYINKKEVDVLDS